MTDANRPDRTLRAMHYALSKAMQAHPSQRICQLIVNATGKSDPFYVENDALVDALLEYSWTVSDAD